MFKKILIVQTAFIGDAILTLPMIQKLKENYPSSKIDVVAIPSTKEIFFASSVVNKVFVFSKRKEHKSLYSTIKFSLYFKKYNYDEIISPHRSLRSSLLVFFASGKNTVGFTSSTLNAVYRTKVEYCKTCHEVERNLKLINADTSNDAWKILPQITADKKAINNIKDIVGEFRRKKIIAVAPGSVWETKRYPADYFATKIKLLSHKGFQLILIGGIEDEKLCNNIIITSGTDCITYAGKLSIVESVELLKYCVLLISNDSAPAHMGMLADIPTVTLFCSTVPKYGFYPYNKKSITLSFDNLKCKPCGIHGYKVCPTGTFDCANKLFPEDVIKAVLPIID